MAVNDMVGSRKGKIEYRLSPRRRTAISTCSPDVAACRAQGGRQGLLFQLVEQDPELLPKIGIRAADAVCDLDAEHPHTVRLFGIGHPFQTEVQQIDRRNGWLGQPVEQMQQHAPAAGMRRSDGGRNQSVVVFAERCDLRGGKTGENPCGTIDEFCLLVEQQSVQLLYGVRSSCIRRYFAHFGRMRHPQKPFSEKHAGLIAHLGIYGIFAGGTGSMEQHAASQRLFGG